MKRIMIIACILANQLVNAQSATGEVVGTVQIGESVEPAFGAVAFIVDQDRKYQALVEADGRFRISAIPAGEYSLNIKFSGDTLTNIPVKIPMDGICQAGLIKFTLDPKMLEVVNVKANDGRMKLEYGSLPIKELTSEEIEQSPLKFSISDLATTLSSEVRKDEDGQLMFRGARKGDMIYMLDGVKSNEVYNVPSCAIGRMMVYTGGLPAKYGDTLGGAVVVETKSYFDLYRAWEREELKKH